MWIMNIFMKGYNDSSISLNDDLPSSEGRNSFSINILEV